VRVYTVGIGTVDGETIGFEGWSMRVRLDEETLKQIATRPRPSTSTPAPRRT
jgi:Ca-activated chloride channel family protein